MPLGSGTPPTYRPRVVAWSVERVVHFATGELVREGVARLGFHLNDGRYCAVAYDRNFLGLVGEDGRLAWTVGAEPRAADMPGISAELDLPIFVN